MSAHLYKPFLAACLLFAAATCLSLLLWRAAGDTDLLALVWEGQREEALDQRLTASHRLLATKTGVVNELIAGRLTLPEAADRFRELSARVAGDGNDDMIGAYRVVSGEEALCHSVLLWAEAELRHGPDPSAAAAVLARLQAAYRERFGRDPGPMPPTVPPSPSPEDLDMISPPGP
jgi:hypothetical protein